MATPDARQSLNFETSPAKDPEEDGDMGGSLAEVVSEIEIEAGKTDGGGETEPETKNKPLRVLNKPMQKSRQK